MLIRLLAVLIGFASPAFAGTPALNEVQKLTATVPVATQGFSLGSISIEGDVALVSSLLEGSPSASGSTYVYRHNGSAWGFEAKLTASDAAVLDLFGNGVLAGTTAFIGSRRDDDGFADSGSVYQFDYSAGTWSETTKLHASDPAANDSFGEALAISNDVLFVGAPFSDVGGAVYVFRDNGSSWIQEAKLTPSDAVASDYFGRGVSATDDGDTVAIGGPGRNTGGGVYIFRYDGMNWSEEVRLTASDGDPSETFPTSIGIDGTRLLVGVEDDSEAEFSAGAVYFFEYDGMSWNEEAKIFASTAGSFRRFGSSTAIDGDRAVIGSSGPGGGALGGSGSAGLAYVFQNVSGSWVETFRLKSSDADVGDRLGSNVGLDGVHLIVGATGDDGEAGAAYVFDLLAPNIPPHLPSFGATGLALLALSLAATAMLRGRWR